MPDNIALLRSGFERVIFHKKVTIKAALRKCSDEYLGKTLHLVGQILCWNFKGLRSVVVPHLASSREQALICLDSDYTFFLNAYKMNYFRNSFPLLPLGFCSAASASWDAEQLIERGKQNVWEFQESSADIFFFSRSLYIFPDKISPLNCSLIAY